MALTSQQRGWCMLEFHKINSVVTVQRAFKHKFNVDPPTNKSILKWQRNFIEIGCICGRRKGHSGRPSVSEQVVVRIRESYLRSPRKSTRRASRGLNVPQSTVSKILRKPHETVVTVQHSCSSPSLTNTSVAAFRTSGFRFSVFPCLRPYHDTPTIQVKHQQCATHPVYQ